MTQEKPQEKNQDMETTQAHCHFKKTKPQMTVGDLFEMHCQWPPHLAVLSPPVRIEFPKPTSTTSSATPKETAPSPYSLVILQTKSVLPGKGVFKVTSYQPGAYHTGFHILSDKGSVEVKPLSWQVESVLPVGQQIKPFPPYGPWTEALPLWYWGAVTLTLIGLLSLIALKIRAFMKRKRKIKEVRLSIKQPYPEFINQLNQLSWINQTGFEKGAASAIFPSYNKDLKPENSNHTSINQTKPPNAIIAETDKAFRLFLENKFFIDALTETPKSIVQQLKKYYPLVFKKNKKKILDFFAEINRLSTNVHAKQLNHKKAKAKPEDLEPIIEMARTTGTHLEIKEQL